MWLFIRRVVILPPYKYQKNVGFPRWESCDAVGPRFGKIAEQPLEKPIRSDHSSPHDFRTMLSPLLLLFCWLPTVIGFSSIPVSVLLRPPGASQLKTPSLLKSSWADVAAEGLVTTTVRSVEVFGKAFSSVFTQFACLNGYQKLLMCAGGSKKGHWKQQDTKG